MGDEPALRNLLAQFQAAYERLDVGAAKDLWPSVDERALSKAFGDLESQTIGLNNCRIQVATATALARCSGPATYVGRLGKKIQSRELNWTFSFDKVSSGWQIRSVETR